ncbi:hypothetical protein HHK36_019572 [Tetracentron sinense]|uniref:U3 small nucleolar RNA-associated protein 11 n=1 Tax=Tetracentron sinense TaxID=13715 RepID=A0A834YWL4_TETSI|nr:hypothetical protein HHK36_019572 [Tetracentron sinense]
MSSLRNAISRRAHKERSQPNARKKFGILEKHKDYVVRAQAFHKKEDSLRKLKEKAAFRNPDEFYFKMIKTRTVDGVHKPESQANNYTQEELMLMKTQDIGYILQKVQSEKKKIEKLTAMLHSLDSQPLNKHVYYAEDRFELPDFTAQLRESFLPPSVLNIELLEPLMIVHSQIGLNSFRDPEMYWSYEEMEVEKDGDTVEKLMIFSGCDPHEPQPSTVSNSTDQASKFHDHVLHTTVVVAVLIPRTSPKLSSPFEISEIQISPSADSSIHMADIHGRVWLMWDLLKLEVTPISVSSQAIYCRVLEIASNKYFSASFINASNLG